MNLIQQAAAEAFESILDDIGVTITINGAEYKAAIAMGGVQIDLEEGGFSQDGSLTVRMLVAHLPDPAPAHYSAMTIGDHRYKIEEIMRKPGAGVIEYRVARR
ncbi:MAG: hypothetical protein KGQ87_03705 [Verrucomicrobia bacterium]|nr:hypothetical protein [Verrucomicrobiota bacterium]